LLEIGKKRAAIVGRMKLALEAQDIQQVLECAAQLCGSNDLAVKKCAQRAAEYVAQ